MDSQRKNARFAGILLLMGWSGALIFPFISVLDGADFPLNIAASGNMLVWGALIQMFMAFSCSGIAVFLYPRLKKENPALALWAVLLRAVEAVFVLAAAAMLLLLAQLGPQFAQAGPEGLAALKSLGALLRSAYHLLGDAPGTLAFCLGAFIYNYLFFRARLIPRWISAWGFIGASVSIVSGILVILGVSSSTVGFISRSRCRGPGTCPGALSHHQRLPRTGWRSRAHVSAKLAMAPSISACALVNSTRNSTKVRVSPSGIARIVTA